MFRRSRDTAMLDRALITGITGQDGSYLARFLLDRGYEVHGFVRSRQPGHSPRLDGIRDRIHLHEGDLVDSASIFSVLREVQPTELYNLAAQSFIPASFSQPLLTADSTALGVTRLLEAIRSSDPEIRFFQASSSELFGSVRESPQNETTPFVPRNPYGAAKAYGHWMTVTHRNTYDLFACSGILFNHESPMRSKQFVTRRITSSVARIVHGQQDKLTLGNLDAQRDWGYAGDFVEAMWLALQHDSPSDYVISTGIQHSVRDLAEIAFRHVGLHWQDYVEVDEDRLRPTDDCCLVGDSTKARTVLDWKPCVSFEQLISMMVDHDLAEAVGESPPKLVMRAA